MNLVTRLALGSLDGSRHLLTRGGRGSLGLRQSIHHLVPSLGQPEPREPSDDSPAATAAKDPSWVLLNSCNCRRVVRHDASMATDNKTLAESRTSMGQQHRLRVSFRLAAPPATSFLYYHYTGSVLSDENNLELSVIAAYGDSIVLRTMPRRRPTLVDGRLAHPTFDHFVYRAGTGTRPPLLTLLPPGLSNFPRKYACGPRFLRHEDTGVLRRGEDDDDLLVAQIDTGQHDDRPDLANLCVLRLGSGKWELKRAVPIVHEEGDELMGSLTSSDMTIPVGDRFLCWVSYCIGLVVCDMGEEEASPKLRDVRLPVYYDPSYYTNNLHPLSDTKGMGAAGPGAVRFVVIQPRCCCGRHGRSSCAGSRFAFTVTTWTLSLMTMDDEPMAWVKDGVLDCEELWAMPGYEGLPRVHLQSPVVSLDNPDVVCFKVAGHADQKAWMIQVDIRRKALLAAVQCAVPWRTHIHFPAKI